MTDHKSRLVYSTDRPVPRKEPPSEKRPAAPGQPKQQQRVTIRLERKGRGGKAVSLIEGLQLGVKEREALLKQLKAKLGAGGTIRDEVIEIQGDHRDAVAAQLEALGYRPKRSGG